MHTVSVIIPTYNRAADLVRAIRSALDQSHPVLEVLVCDDGSTDDSEARVRAIQDARVKWIPGAHAGRPAVPRNRGIAVAAGEWLAFLDSDDLWHADKIAVQLRCIAGTPLRMSCTNAERVVPGEGSKGPYFTDQQGPFTLADILRVNRVICSSVLIQRDVLMRTGPFPEGKELKALEDYALWLRAATFTAIDYCPDPLVFYTDAPATSVRSQEVSLAVQRDAVLSDVHRWDKFGTLPLEQRKLITRYLRGARRSAGRSIMDWLFIR